MLLRLEDIPPEGLDLTLRLPPEALAAEGFAAPDPVEGTFHLVRLGPGALVRGRVAGRYRTTCSRCLSEIAGPIDEEVLVEFRPLSHAEGEGREHELAGDDLDVEFFEEGTLDLGNLLAEQVRLALPMKPLCREDCPGLCPRCGKDRREGCGCGDGIPDERWEPLRGLLKKD